MANRSGFYTIGVDYSGIIEKQHVDNGAHIKKGDPLFEIHSPTLAEAIRNNEVAKSSLLYAVEDSGKILISAAANGQVQTVKYRQGAFVPANSEIAVINVENGLYVSATYKLSSPDYARLNNNSKLAVTLPDNKTFEGTVYDVSLATVDKEVLTTVRAHINQDDINKAVFSAGTPIETTLYLDTTTWFSRISNFVQSLFQPKSGL